MRTTTKTAPRAATKTAGKPKKTATPEPVRDAAIAWAHETLTPDLAATFAKAEVRRGDYATWIHLVADAAGIPAAEQHASFMIKARAILGMADEATDKDVLMELVAIRRALDAQQRPATTPAEPTGETPRTDAEREAERATLRLSRVDTHNRHYEMTIGDLIAGMVGGTPRMANPAPSLLDIVSTQLGLLQMAEDVDGGISDSFRERVTFQIQNLAQYGAELMARVAHVRAKAAEGGA